MRERKDRKVAFSRRGIAEPILEVNLKYNTETEISVLCPKCGAILKDMKKSQGLIKTASKIVVGSVILICPKCKETVQV